MEIMVPCKLSVSLDLMHEAKDLSFIKTKQTTYAVNPFDWFEYRKTPSYEGRNFFPIPNNPRVNSKSTPFLLEATAKGQPMSLSSPLSPLHSFPTRALTTRHPHHNEVEGCKCMAQIQTVLQPQGYYCKDKGPISQFCR